MRVTAFKIGVTSRIIFEVKYPNYFYYQCFNYIKIDALSYIFPHVMLLSNKFQKTYQV
jgi:hypothetical protein